MSSINSNYENHVLINDRSRIQPSLSLYSKILTQTPQNGSFPIDPEKDYRYFNSTKIVKYPKKCLVLDSFSNGKTTTLDWRNSSTPSTSSTTTSGISSTISTYYPSKDEAINSRKKLPKTKKTLNLISFLIVFLMAITLILAALILILWLRSIGWPPLAIQKLNEERVLNNPYEFLLKANLEEVIIKFKYLIFFSKNGAVMD